MDRFVAPQFIDVEDRIIGPITTRQFIMMVIGGIVCFASVKLLDTGAFALVAFLVVVFVIVFGFVKINGRHFAPFVASIIEAIKRPKVRVWHKQVTQASLAKLQEEEKVREVKSDLVPRKRITGSQRLAELALMVDTGGRFEG